jgi:Heparinase II/III-like protein/Heparinase II/III N-terminus
MVAGIAELAWYARRLSRMSSAEVSYRFLEQGKKLSDRHRRYGWCRFGEFKGPLKGYPGLGARTSGSASLHVETAAIHNGSFRMLGQCWPDSLTGRAWWDTASIWHRDPVSSHLWPGAEMNAFQVNYRQRRCYGDVKFIWELNRLQFLQVLAADQATEHIPAMISSWMGANPPFRGINWTSGIEAASRILSLLVVLAFADQNVRTSLDGPARCLIEAHAYWIARYPSLYSSANNHRAAELAALLLAALCAPGMPGAAEYRRVCHQAIERLSQTLFHRDGVGAEQSPTYAAYSLEWLVLAAIGSEAEGMPFSSAFRDRVEAAAWHLRWMMDDGGGVPRIGDDDEGRVLVASARHSEPRYVASILALVARWLGDHALQPPAHDPHLRDWLAPRPPSCSTATASIGGMRVFAEGGYTVARTPTQQGTVLFVFDHGPLGFGAIAAHGHADSLAVWLHWGEEAVLVDAGTYLYHAGGCDRDLFRSTRVHNTLVLNGADQSRIAGPFNWSRHARTRIIARDERSVTAQHDGYLRALGLLHRRRIECAADGDIVISDYLVGAPRQQSLSWSIGFTLGPDVMPSVHARNADIVTRAGRRLSLEVEGNASAWNCEQTPFSAAFNSRAVVYRLSSCGQVRRSVNYPVATTRIRLRDVTKSVFAQPQAVHAH